MIFPIWSIPFVFVVYCSTRAYFWVTSRNKKPVVRHWENVEEPK